MKIVKSLLILAISNTIATSVLANDSYEYQNNSNNNVKQLITEIHELKSEIRELKKIVLKHSQYSLDHNRGNKVQQVHSRINKWSCFINTSFNGSFTATGRTKNEAMGRTLGKCHNKVNSSVSCNERELKCSAE